MASKEPGVITTFRTAHRPELDRMAQEEEASVSKVVNDAVREFLERRRQASKDTKMINRYLTLMVGGHEGNPFGGDWVEKPYSGSLLPVGTTLDLGGRSESLWAQVDSHHVNLAEGKEFIKCRFTQMTAEYLENNESLRGELWMMLQSDGWVEE